MMGNACAVARAASGLGAWLRRAKDVVQEEGLTPLLSRGFGFVRESFFKYAEYYLYEHSLRERDEALFMPRIEGLIFRIVRTNEEADELAVELGSDFRRRFVRARRSLDKSAIAFCFFADGEIAHIGWVALSKEAKACFDPVPYEVDFRNRVACTGGTITVPKYRSRGLMTYGYVKRLRFLRELGWRASRNCVVVDNIASQKAQGKLGPRVYARARCLKLLRWRFLWQRPIGDDVAG